MEMLWSFELIGVTKYFLNQWLTIHLGVSGINLATGVMYAWSALWLCLGGVWGVARRSR